MPNGLKSLGIWALAGILAAMAFLAGAGLRSRQVATAVTSTDTEHTYALLKLTPEFAPTTPDAKSSGKVENKALVDSVVKLLRIHYVEPMTAERETAMAQGAVRGMLDALGDPDSRFLDPKERKLLDDAGAGKFSGIGAVFAIRNEKIGEMPVSQLTVVAPMPGSPSESAGLKPGDSITHVDGKWIITHDPFSTPEMEKLAKAARNKEIDDLTFQKTYETAYNKLKDGITISAALEELSAKSSGEIKVRAERPGGKSPIEMKLERRVTSVDPVVARMLDGGIAYIRVSQFSEQAAKEFVAELDHARGRGAKALVLDLRNNPGGLMSAAVDVARRLTGGGIVANIHEKGRRRAIRSGRTDALDIPIAVIVNGGTSSVSEMLAGTLQEHDASLIGATTFGDGLLQTPLLLKDGSAAIVTTGRMLTAKGMDFEGKGIKPDRNIKEQASSKDAQLQEAQRVLRAKMGRV